MLSVPSQLGYPVLFALIFGESAGLPLPGETALLTAGVLAGTGRLSLPLVIGVAIVAAVTGDTLGYWLGRRGGRAILARRRGPFAALRLHALERGELFFDRHGAKTVFLGRFVPGVRVVAAVLAGAGTMPWPRFAIYNLAGAFVWASTVASLASLVGPAVAAGAVVVAARRRGRRRAGGAGALAAGHQRRRPAGRGGTHRGSADAAARPWATAPRRPPPSPTTASAGDVARARRRAAPLPRPPPPLHELPARHRRGRRRVHREGLGHGRPRLALRRLLARPAAVPRGALQARRPGRPGRDPRPRRARRARARGRDDAPRASRRRPPRRPRRGALERGPGELDRADRGVLQRGAARRGAGLRIRRLPGGGAPPRPGALAGGRGPAGRQRGADQAVLPRRGLRRRDLPDRDEHPRPPPAPALGRRLRGRRADPARPRRDLAVGGARVAGQPRLRGPRLPRRRAARARGVDPPAARPRPQPAPPRRAVRPLRRARRRAGRAVGAAPRPRARGDARSPGWPRASSACSAAAATGRTT